MCRRSPSLHAAVAPSTTGATSGSPQIGFLAGQRDLQSNQASLVIDNENAGLAHDEDFQTISLPSRFSAQRRKQGVHDHRPVGIKHRQSCVGVALKPRHLLNHVLYFWKDAKIFAALLLKSEVACAMNEEPWDEHWINGDGVSGARRVICRVASGAPLGNLPFPRRKNPYILEEPARLRP